MKSAASPAHAALALQGLALQIGCSDPKSCLRIAVPLPPPLRVALSAQLAARGGQVIDGMLGLSSFHQDIAQAVQLAIEILTQGTSLLAEDTRPLALRIVLVGVRGSSDDARGAALTRATRVLALTRDQTLLLTRDLHEALDAALAERSRLAASPSSVDDHPELGDLFDLDWRNAGQRLPDITQISEPEAQPVQHLQLSHGDTELELRAADCPLVVGRDKSCALHVGGDVASRVHGRIEFSRDCFYFVDDSRNGTYLLTPQGDEVFLHRERLPLLGRGVISPGAPIVKQTAEVIRYTCREGEPQCSAASALPSDIAKTLAA